MSGIDVERWNEADADPLRDLQKWRDRMTGRLPSEPEMQRLPTPLDDIDRAIVESYEGSRVAIIAGGDFSTLEARVLAILGDESVNSILIDIETPDQTVDRIVGPMEDMFLKMAKPYLPRERTHPTRWKPGR